MLPLFLRKLGLRFGVTLPFVSEWINSYYNALPTADKSRWHAMYRSLEPALRSSKRNWKITVPGACGYIVFPIKYWEQLLTLNGYDPELKLWYARLLGPDFDTFIDVGANYGTHSFLAMHYGMNVVMFEPNIDCLPCIREVCVLNKWAPTIMQAAVGSSSDKVCLFSPTNGSWLGIVGRNREEAIAQKFASDPEGGPEGAQKALQYFNEAGALNVLQITLDSYVHVLQGSSVLKLDVEGSELAVLKGAHQLLTTYHPVVVFESFPSKGNRALLWDVLCAHEYNISPIVNQHRLSREGFLTSLDSNFYAVKN